MTNKEKFKEVFGYEPGGFFCPEKCPEEFVCKICRGCPYHDFENKEYKKPEQKEKKDSSELSIELAKIIVDLEDILSEHSPVELEDLRALICIFMDSITGDTSTLEFDIISERSNFAEKILKEWPHSVEYYKIHRKEDNENDC